MTKLFISLMSVAAAAVLFVISKNNQIYLYENTLFFVADIYYKFLQFIFSKV